MWTVIFIFSKCSLYTPLVMGCHSIHILSLHVFWVLGPPLARKAHADAEVAHLFAHHHLVAKSSHTHEVLKGLRTKCGPVHNKSCNKGMLNKSKKGF